MRCLQLRITASIGYYIDFHEDSLLLPGVGEPLAATDELALLSNLIIAPLKAWKEANTAFAIVHTAHECTVVKVTNSGQDCEFPIRETLQTLANVSHLSHGVSIDLDQDLFEAHQEMSDNPSASESSLSRYVEPSTHTALELGTHFGLFNLTNTITSLSLRDIPFASRFQTGSSEDHLEHLEINSECSPKDTLRGVGKLWLAKRKKTLNSNSGEVHSEI